MPRRANGAFTRMVRVYGMGVRTVVMRRMHRNRSPVRTSESISGSLCAFFTCSTMANVFDSKRECKITRIDSALLQLLLLLELAAAVGIVVVAFSNTFETRRARGEHSRENITSHSHSTHSVSSGRDKLAKRRTGATGHWDKM